MPRNQPSALILVSTTFFLAVVAAACGTASGQSETVTADDALKDLMDGNARFAKGEATSPRRSPAAFRAVSEAQSPIAVVAGDADHE